MGIYIPGRMFDNKFDGSEISYWNRYKYIVEKILAE